MILKLKLESQHDPRPSLHNLLRVKTSTEGVVKHKYTLHTVLALEKKNETRMTEDENDDSSGPIHTIHLKVTGMMCQKSCGTFETSKNKESPLHE
jgi:hypothetical protein